MATGADARRARRAKQVDALQLTFDGGRATSSTPRSRRSASRPSSRRAPAPRSPSSLTRGDYGARCRRRAPTSCPAAAPEGAAAAARSRGGARSGRRRSARRRRARSLVARRRPPSSTVRECATRVDASCSARASHPRPLASLAARARARPRRRRRRRKRRRRRGGRDPRGALEEPARRARRRGRARALELEPDQRRHDGSGREARGAGLAAQIAEANGRALAAPAAPDARGRGVRAARVPLATASYVDDARACSAPARARATLGEMSAARPRHGSFGGDGATCRSDTASAVAAGHARSLRPGVRRSPTARRRGRDGRRGHAAVQGRGGPAWRRERRNGAAWTSPPRDRRGCRGRRRAGCAPRASRRRARSAARCRCRSSATEPRRDAVRAREACSAARYRDAAAGAKMRARPRDLFRGTRDGTRAGRLSRGLRRARAPRRSRARRPRRALGGRAARPRDVGRPER